MVSSLYELLVDQNQAEAELILEKHGIGLFDPLKDSFPEEWFKYVQFILKAFSIDSEYDFIGADWREFNTRIIQLCGFNDDSDEFVDGLVDLKVDEVAFTVDNYLKFQNEREFRHLRSLNALYDQMISSVYKADVAYDQKKKNMAHARELWVDIQEFEKVTYESYDKRKAGYSVKAKKVAVIVNDLNNSNELRRRKDSADIETFVN